MLKLLNFDIIINQASGRYNALSETTQKDLKESLSPRILGSVSLSVSDNQKGSVQVSVTWLYRWRNPICQVMRQRWWRHLAPVGTQRR